MMRTFCNVFCCEQKLHGKTEDLTDEETAVVEEWLNKSNFPILRKETSDLVVDTILIYYVFKSRASQIEAIGVSITQV